MPRLMTPMKWKVMAQYVDYPMGASAPFVHKSGIATKEEAEREVESNYDKDRGTFYWVEEDK